MPLPPVLAGQRITAALLNGLPTGIALATGSMANSATETVIGSFQIPANTITAVNSGFQYYIYGTADNVVTATPTIAFSTRLGTTGTTSDQGIAFGPTITCRATAQTGQGWWIEGWINFGVTGASGGVYQRADFYQAITAAPNTMTPVLSGGLVSGGGNINTTVANQLTVTAHWSAASASNIARSLAGALYLI
jgi:hypothetical protein